MRESYEQRAPEYDDWWNGAGQFAQRERPGWDAEVAALIAVLRALSTTARATRSTSAGSSPPSSSARWAAA